jgi:hypothetical protein
MAEDQAVGKRRYRRYVVVFLFILGVALGVGVGSLAALAGRWEVILLLVLVIAPYVLARSKRSTRMRNPTVWVWPGVALVVAFATFILVSPQVAPIGLGLAVAIWFGLIVVGGVLEIVLDPEGRLADASE